MSNGKTIKLAFPYQNTVRYKVFLPWPPALYNRYHWNREEIFLEGWYHRVVATDPGNSLPTTFFWLTGVNNPSGRGPQGHAKSFLICGNAGQNDGRRFSTPGRLFEKYIPVTHPKAFWAERKRGMNVIVNSSQSNTVYGLFNEYWFEGKVVDDANNWMKWRVDVINKGGNLFPYPMEKMPPLLGIVPTGIDAYYYCGKMWADFTGEIHIKENGKYKKFNFSNARGYQDHNWGVGGFPHPWIWIAANRFREGENLSGPIIAKMALVFIWGTLSATGPDPDVAALKIVRPGQSDMEMLCIPAFTQMVHKFFFKFKDSGRYVKKAEIKIKGDFGLGHCSGGVLNPARRAADTSKSSVEVKMEGAKGDKVFFQVDCFDKTLMHLPAPKNKMMVPCLASESLQGTLRLTINGKKYISDFSAIESDLTAPITKKYENDWF